MKLEMNNFTYAVNAIKYEKRSNIDSKHNMKLSSLASEFYFQLSDIVYVVQQMIIHFKKIEKEQISKLNEQYGEKTKKYPQAKKHIIESYRNELLNYKEAFINQVDLLSIGIFMRSHSLLEEVLKEICSIIKTNYNLAKTYKDMKREKPDNHDKISTFEKCVLYIIKSPMDSKLFLDFYDFLYDSNSLRNILIHAGGSIIDNNQEELVKKLNLQIRKKKPSRITIDFSTGQSNTDFTESKAKVKLNLDYLLKYLQIMDLFLAYSVNSRFKKQQSETNELINNAITEIRSSKTFDFDILKSIEEFKSSNIFQTLYGDRDFNQDMESFLVENVTELIKKF